MAGEPVLELKGVTKAFGDLEVLRGIDLTVHEHEAVALIGASGSGKSTLLRCVDLLEEIDDGDVFLDGDVITDPSVSAVGVRRRLGLVFQAYNLFPHLSALDNVLLGLVQGHGTPKAEARTRALALLERFGLAGREDDYPDRLSGGQQQRVAIARAFGTRPRAMMLDEVTSALDPELVGEVLQAVRDLKDEGVTMLLATHEMGFAREVADRVGFLHEGRLLEVAPPVEAASKTPRSRRPSGSCGGCWSRAGPDLSSARHIEAHARHATPGARGSAVQRGRRASGGPSAGSASRPSGSGPSRSFCSSIGMPAISHRTASRSNRSSDRRW